MSETAKLGVRHKMCSDSCWAAIEGPTALLQPTFPRCHLSLDSKCRFKSGPQARSNREGALYSVTDAFSVDCRKRGQEEVNDTTRRDRMNVMRALHNPTGQASRSRRNHTQDSEKHEHAALMVAWTRWENCTLVIS